MLRDTVRACPDDQWKAGGEYLTPVRLAYHIIMAAERYVSALPAEEHKKVRRYGLNWLGPVDQMPERSELLADVTWIESAVESWIDDRGDNGLLEPGDLFPHTGALALDTMLYLLRHSQLHIGEMIAELRIRGHYRDVWK